MRALVIDHQRRMAVAERPFVAGAGECRVRVRLAGICGTDLELFAGYADFAGIPGHEFVGTVEDAPEGDEHWIGKRVVGEINVGCGSCDWCERGVKEHCSRRTVLGIRDRAGAFAEWLSLPAANLHAVPRGVSDEAAVFAEPVAAACRIFEQVTIDGDTRMAVIGDGRLGNVTAQVMRTRTSHVVLFGRHPHKLRLAQSVGIDARPGDASSDAPFDVVVDATGRAAGLARAIELVKPRGSIVLKSTFHGDAHTPLWPVPVHEVTVVGSRCGPFAPALALLASGAVKTAPLVAETYSLAEHDRGFDLARRAMKVLLDPRRP